MHPPLGHCRQGQRHKHVRNARCLSLGKIRTRSSDLSNHRYRLLILLHSRPTLSCTQPVRSTCTHTALQAAAAGLPTAVSCKQGRSSSQETSEASSSSSSYSRKQRERSLTGSSRHVSKLQTVCADGLEACQPLNQDMCFLPLLPCVASVA